MRTVRFVQDLDEFKAGEVLEVEDQIACGAIAQGYAVPCVDAAQPRIATVAADAPEVVVEVAPAEAAPEAAVVESIA